MDWEQHAARLARAKKVEHSRAATLLDSFAAAARRAQLPTELLLVRGYSGGKPVRSNVRGWYLRKDHSAGVGTHGEFYLLSAPIGVRERLFGVQLHPSPAPLVLGAGSRDGESIGLVDALLRLLPTWQPPEE